MKSVLISIRPEYCEKIASGKKTIEVRKTRPKLETPFRCYIYCTENGAGTHPTRYVWKKRDDGFGYYWNGKVIGEFVCDNITNIIPVSSASEGHKNYFGLSELGWKSTCLTPVELIAYGGEYKKLYGWHISDLKIYDKPRELSEFCRFCGEDPNCDGCGAHYYSSTECGTEEYCCSTMEGCKPITRAPQSWMYVEGLE